VKPRYNNSFNYKIPAIKNLNLSPFAVNFIAAPITKSLLFGPFSFVEARFQCNKVGLKWFETALKQPQNCRTAAQNGPQNCKNSPKIILNDPKTVRKEQIGPERPPIDSERAKMIPE
jgi:hypothetical protein